MGFVQTTVYNAPQLTYANTTFTVAGVALDPLPIPLVLESYTSSVKANVNIVSTMPVITGDGLAFGGSYVSHSSTELPKLVMEGYMDTPMGPSSVAKILRPTVLSGTFRYTYAEIVVAHLEGRVNNWTRTDPLTFRDPYGRQWTNPRVLDFTASYVESVPGRTRFNLTLVVTS